MVEQLSSMVTGHYPLSIDKSDYSSGAEGPPSVRSSEDGSEGSAATGGGSSSYKERGEFHAVCSVIEQGFPTH